LLLDRIFPTVKYETGGEKIPSPCVLVSNHCSYLDIVLSYIPFQLFCFCSQAGTRQGTLFRIFFRRMNILVNRKSTVDSHKAYIHAGERIDKGKNVFIFPEATISSNGSLIPFKNGAFKLAIDKQVPIVPLVFPTTGSCCRTAGFLNRTDGRPCPDHCPEIRGNKRNDQCRSDPFAEKVKSIIQETLDQNT